MGVDALVSQTSVRQSRAMHSGEDVQALFALEINSMWKENIDGLVPQDVADLLVRACRVDD